MKERNCGIGAKPGQNLACAAHDAEDVGVKCCWRCRPRKSYGKCRADWTCRWCGAKCCEHLCGFRKPDRTAACGECQVKLARRICPKCGLRMGPLQCSVCVIVGDWP